MALNSAFKISVLQSDDNTGWNPLIFVDPDESFLCEICNNICKDAVELDCIHEYDNEVNFCEKCLQQALVQNANTCPINNSHRNVSFHPSRMIRKLISKLTTCCPNSVEYKNRAQNYGNPHVVDTAAMDQKEGPGSYHMQNVECHWRGSFNELKKHLNECALHPQDTIQSKVEQFEVNLDTLSSSVFKNHKEFAALKDQFNDLKLLYQNKFIETENQIKILQNQLNNQQKSYPFIGIKDKFDPQNKGQNMILSQNNTFVTKANTADHESIFLNNIIDGTSKYHWKFKIISFIKGAWNPFIGIYKMNSSASYPVNNYFTNKANNGYAYVSFKGQGNKTNPLYPGSKLDRYGEAMKTGDIIDMFVDMNALTLRFDHNGKNKGIAFEIDRTEYKAAICLYKSGNSVQLLTFSKF